MRIEQYRFGSIRINGKTYDRDLKILGEKVIQDWRRKSGHRVEPDDVADLVAAGPDVLILGTGSPGQMKPAPELETELAKKAIRLIAKPTAEAVETFNRLAGEGLKMAAAFHLTC